MPVTRWNPKSRAGAVSVRPSRAHDLEATRALHQNVADWARYQSLAGETDAVETSPITGNYDWRSYLQEEAQLARRREESRAPREKKQERPAPTAAPSTFYA